MDLSFDAKYAVISGRDARFDGVFYTAVESTGIYCRPSCPARTPSKTRVRFYDSAAAAQGGGFRPCRRCFPEAVPGSSQWLWRRTLVGRALALIEDGVADREGLDGVASRLGYTTRSLHRLLSEHTGATPLEHVRARRARAAADLLRHTDVPCADVAFASGFASVRQFNETIKAVFGRTPRELRDRAHASSAGLTARVAYRIPFDFEGLLAWFRPRALAGVEVVDDASYTRAVVLPRGPGVIRITNDPDRAQLLVRCELADVRDLAPAVALARRLFDTNADPVAIDAALAQHPGWATLVAERPGVRLPGVASLHEALLRAIVGQQITVTSAIGMLTDLAADGTPVSSALGVERCLPSSERAAATAEEWFRGPGARRAAIVAAMGAVGDVEAAEDPAAALLAINGVGPWTANYALMRWAQHPDVWPTGDVALLAAARRRGLGETHTALELTSRACSPWRSYAAMHLWHDQMGRS